MPALTIRQRRRRDLTRLICSAVLASLLLALAAAFVAFAILDGWDWYTSPMLLLAALAYIFTAVGACHSGSAQP